ncbi:hypothetical protein HR13_04525 [Porphyromonas gulae]|nr:hypothetical protein HR13_04525 [Porphyromonas gulae]
MKVLGYVNRFSRGAYRVQKELKENGNEQASFDFSLLTAFRVVENVSQKYFEESFGGETSKTTQERILAAILAKPEITQKSSRSIGITLDGRAIAFESLYCILGLFVVNQYVFI